MTSTYWHKQGVEPLFPDLLWSRPETRQARGKLLIVGGNLHGFSAPAEAYKEAEKAGVGTSRVILPDALKKIVGLFLEQAEFGASTPSGSFSSHAYSELALQASWADGVLLAGDLGRNSETAVMLEKFVEKYRGQLTVTKDAIDYFKDSPRLLVERENTTIIGSLAQIQKLVQNIHYEKPVTFSMGLVQLVDLLHDFTEKYSCNLIVKHLGNLLVAAGGQVSTTAGHGYQEIWRVKTAASAAVWWLQNPSKTFEALTTSVHE